MHMHNMYAYTYIHTYIHVCMYLLRLEPVSCYPEGLAEVAKRFEMCAVLETFSPVITRPIR